MGLEVHRGLARTGVVASIRAGGSGRAIGLRADMDALPVTEANTFAHVSRHPGRMHACGHDGHTVMLLGAARYLAATRCFDGTVHLVFQPAEEGQGGARTMVAEGLFERFPVDAVYGLHNQPGLPVGQFAVHHGPAMASSDSFSVRLLGRGGHAAQPHLASDAVLAACALVTSLQGVVARNVPPLESAVLSVAQVHAGTADNVLPESAEIRGTCRSHRPEVRDLLERRLREVAAGVAAAHGVGCEVVFVREEPPLVNSIEHAGHAARAAAAVVGEQNVRLDLPPSMGAEDFAVMLEHRPGAYIRIGNGPLADHDGAAPVHHPRYDFNDEALAYGAAWWATLVEQRLAPGG